MATTSSQSLCNAIKLNFDITEFVNLNKNNYINNLQHNIRIRDFSTYHGYELLDKWVELTATNKATDFEDDRRKISETERQRNIIRNIRGIYGELVFVMDLVKSEYLIDWLKSVYIISFGKNTGNNANKDIKKEWMGGFDIEIKSCHKNSDILRFSTETTLPLNLAVAYEFDHRKKYVAFPLRKINKLKFKNTKGFIYYCKDIPEFNKMKKLEEKRART